MSPVEVAILLPAGPGWLSRKPLRIARRFRPESPAIHQGAHARPVSRRQVFSGQRSTKESVSPDCRHCEVCQDLFA